MNRVKCTISYDGTNFQGYQVQPNKRTVQGEIERVLEKMHKGEEVRIHASGRTDALVHAVGQVIHFDTTISMESRNWQKALNAMLPEDISVREVEIVDSTFHSRFSCIGKEYRYRVYIGEVRDPLKRFYTYHYPYSLNLEAIQQACQYLLGTHDFTSFCSAKTEIEDRVRTIEEFQVDQVEDELIFRIKGNGFLYNMVRIIVGTMLDVGAGRFNPEEIPVILGAKDRTRAGKTAPASGLYLWKVYYK